MPDSILPPPPEPVKPTLPSWAAAALAILTSIGGILTAVQQAASSLDTQKAAYEALKRADENKTEQLVQITARLSELARSQLELRAWVEELSTQLDTRATNTERAIRKVVKPKSKLPPAPPPPPPPPPPPQLIEVHPSAPLPPFEQLSH